MRVFYVVYPSDPDIATYLDAIRLLADPTEKARAHVTLRGPYPQRLGMKALSSVVTSTPVCVEGVGQFFEARQSTVFLRCDSPAFRRVWFKRDYPEYNPHITLYDGKSRVFAAELSRTLSALDVLFSFMPSPLEPVVSTKGQRDGSLLMDLDYKVVSRAAGRDVNAEVLRECGEAERIDVIGRIASRLVEISRKRSAQRVCASAKAN